MQNRRGWGDDSIVYLSMNNLSAARSISFGLRLKAIALSFNQYLEL